MRKRPQTRKILCSRLVDRVKPAHFPVILSVRGVHGTSHFFISLCTYTTPPLLQLEFSLSCSLLFFFLSLFPSAKISRSMFPILHPTFCMLVLHLYSLAPSTLSLFRFSTASLCFSSRCCFSPQLRYSVPCKTSSSLTRVFSYTSSSSPSLQYLRFPLLPSIFPLFPDFLSISDDICLLPLFLHSSLSLPPVLLFFPLHIWTGAGRPSTSSCFPFHKRRKHKRIGRPCDTTTHSLVLFADSPGKTTCCQAPLNRARQTSGSPYRAHSPTLKQRTRSVVPGQLQNPPFGLFLHSSSSSSSSDQRSLTEAAAASFPSTSPLYLFSSYTPCLPLFSISAGGIVHLLIRSPNKH